MPTHDPAADWARSGAVALTGRAGGPPAVPPGRAATVAGELAGRLAAGAGVRVDGARLLAERAAYTGHGRRGTISAGGSCRLLPTADGWAAVSCARPDDPALLGALACRDVGDDPWPAVARWLREHTGDELAESAGLLGLAAGPVRSRPGTPVLPEGPLRRLDGLLVADFSALWAGPLCAHLLGLAGARVVKVETPDRPDGARRGNAEFYRLLHAGHRSAVLDPRTAAGRRALAALAEAADIVIESSRPRALAGFGLDAGTAVAAGTIWVSITAYGRASGRVGFGDDVAAASGLVARDAGGVPLFCGDAIADPLGGLTAAALAAAAPPGGALVEVAMADVVAGTLTDHGRPPAVRAAGEGWVVETASGPVPVAAPERRAPADQATAGRAAGFGEHTGEVLRELGVPAA